MFRPCRCGDFGFVSRHKPTEHRIQDVSATPDVEASSFTSCCGRRVSLFERRCGVTVCLQSRHDATTAAASNRNCFGVAVSRSSQPPQGWERGSVGSKRCKRVDEYQLEAGLYAKCRAGHCWPDRTVSRQSDALVKLFDDHFLFVGFTFGEPRRDHRVLDGFPMATPALSTLLSWMWMTSLWDEKRARHSRPALWLTHQV